MIIKNTLFYRCNPNQHVELVDKLQKNVKLANKVIYCIILEEFV